MTMNSLTVCTNVHIIKENICEITNGIRIKQS